MKVTLRSGHRGSLELPWSRTMEVNALMQKVHLNVHVSALKKSWLSEDSGGKRRAPHMAEQTLTDVKTERELQCLL